MRALMALLKLLRTNQESPVPASRRKRPIPAPRQRQQAKKPVDEFRFKQTPFVIGSFLRGWEMNFPEGYNLNADSKAFFEGVPSNIHQKLVE